MSGLRVPTQTRSGQGAGIAAAISVVDNVPLNGVDMTKVQAELIAQGGRIA